MAAYAALVSLLNNMEQVRNHPRLSNCFEKKQMESLLQRVVFLLDFIESYNSHGGNREETEDLESQIACAAHVAEDVIESHIVVQIVAGANSQQVMLDLRKIIQDMDSVKEKVVMKVKEECEYNKAELLAASSRPPTAGKSNMVGFEGYFAQLLDQIIGHKTDRQIIPIVGMGGIGKTTLTRNAYDSLLVVRHFDVRSWVTVSQTYIVKDIIYEILSCLGQSKDGMHNKTEHELGELLHRTLFGRRYLIVLDDMWSTEVWDRIKFFFPNNRNGSRIVVTTRISDVANNFGSIELVLNFLDDVQSWKLFCEKVFPHEDCPAELEERGKKIVRKCGGLPLAIVVIGGLLGNLSRTQDQWENIAKDVSSTLNMVEDNRCLKLLSLSYSHLPARLKPCFLYMGIFPEDNIINVSRLTKLWVAEGFIKPNKDQTLEETAESYVKDLVDRNLISFESFRWNGKVKTFCIHDLLRDLCIRVAVKEKFLCITSETDTPRESDQQRRVVIHATTYDERYLNTLVPNTSKSKYLVRSLIINQGRQVIVKSGLLRVLVGVHCEPRDAIFQKVNLRFVALEYSIRSGKGLYSYQLPSSISLLWNVQTLIIKEGVYKVYAPSEIWEMPQLRHLMFSFISFPEPPPGDGIVLHNLQTLGTVFDFTFNEEVCKRMPNVKKLHARFSYLSRGSGNFASFNKLESLHYQLALQPERERALQSLKFPNSLKKLTLIWFPLQLKDLRVIGSLPHLEALILENSVRGPNWDPVEGEFLRLRFLRVVDSDLVCWNADDTHFPVLQNLVLQGLYFLNEIPSGIGDIQTLERISLTNCSDSCALSAVKILEVQQNLGNGGLQVKVHFESEWGVKKLMEKVEAEGLRGLNFQIDFDW